MKKLLVIFLTLLIGCDIVHHDADVDLKPEKTIQLVTYNNRPTVIDLQNIIPGFTNLNIANQTGITYFDNRYISYTPGQNTPEQFTFNYTRPDKTKRSVRVVAQGKSSQNCADAFPFTYAKISNTETLSVNLFNNPEFCGYDTRTGNNLGVILGQPGVDILQNIDGLWLNLCLNGNNGNTAILTYAPPDGFVGQVRATYYLGVNGYERENDPSIYYSPNGHDYFSTHDVIIDVVNSL